MKRKNITDPIFQMSRSERNGSIVLVVILVLLLIFRFAIPKLFDNNDEIPAEVLDRMMQIERDQDSIFAVNAEKKAERKAYYNKSQTDNQSSYNKDFKNSFSSKKQEPASSELFFFDPNDVSSDDLLKLGFSKRVASIVLKFRDKGGKFKNEEDLRKIYGVDSIFFERIRPYIKIEKLEERTFPKQEEQAVVEINGSDSVLLTTLRGIGPSYAGRICKYRNMLGGFTSVNQLLEIYNFPQETFDAVKDHLIVDISKVRKINVNFADISELKSHPYCKYDNAKKIVNYRSKHGSFKSIDQLLTDSLLTSEVFLKLSPYLAVE